MKICGKCHKEYSDEFKFCPKDGSPIEPAFDGTCCPYCKRPVSPQKSLNYMFCPFCGKKIFFRLKYGNIESGDSVKFGQWPLKADGTVYPIEWTVLDIAEDDILLVSKYAIDAYKYGLSDEDPAVNWEESGIRVWLNGYFYFRAFNNEEKKLISRHIIADSGKNGYSVYDNIFLLSITEAEKYFKTDEDRKAFVTPYSVKQGIYVRKKSYTAWWWLRNTGKMSPLFAAFVGADGDLHTGGNYMDIVHGGVRPAFYMKMH